MDKQKCDLYSARGQIANICWIIKKAREFQEKTSISALLTMLKPMIVWFTTNWKILKDMGKPHHLTCLLRNLYAGQETTVRTGHGTMDWFQIGKGVCLGCILLPCLFNFLMKVKEESEKVGLSSTFRKLRSQHLVPSLHGK